MQHHLRCVLSLERVATAFDAAGIPWLTMKGPALAEAMYRRTDARQYADLDVLIAPAAFPDAMVALEDRGARMLERDWRKVRAQRRGQLHIVLDTGVVVDAHWHLMNRGIVRDDFTIDTAELLGRRVHPRIGRQALPTLDAVDTLAHVGLHAALAGGARLRWLLDVNEVVRSTQLDWAAVVDRLRSWGATSGVGIVLARAKLILRTPIPDDVLAALCPSTTLRAVDTVLTRSIPRSGTTEWFRPELMGLRLVRQTPRRSLAAATRRGGGWVRQVLTGERDRRDVFGVERDAGDRSVYLQMVAEGRLDR